MLDKLAVARALREIGLLLEVKGENHFKVRAYEVGARSLDESVEDLPALVAAGRLRELPGVGEALAKKIADMHLTGHTPLLDRLRSELPRGILELLTVPELGPKKVAALAEALGVGSLAELEAACRAGRVREVKGFGAKTEARILASLERLAAAEPTAPRLLLPDALGVAERLVAWLGEAVARVEVAGEARRGVEAVETVELVAASHAPAAALERFAAFPAAAEATRSGDGEATLRLASGGRARLRVVPPERFGAALLDATGSAAHLARLSALAHGLGLVLGPDGLAPAAGGPPRPSPEEADAYRALGLAPVPAELREAGAERDAASSEGLVALADVRGFVHCHTDWSDGRATVEAMARAAEALGAEYLTVTDHSPAAGYAGGLDVDRLRAQADEIARVQEGTRVRLLRGLEADILEDGALDVPDGAWEHLDVVVASVHARHRQGAAEMTRRLVRAMEAPVFKIWGHALGRLLLDRPPFECDVDAVLDALARSRGAVEVNGDPRRMEADPEVLRRARARGIPIVLSVDAHSTGSLGYLRWAVTVARRGGVRRGEVLNALDADAFVRAVRPVRAG